MLQLSDNGGFKLRSALIGAVVAVVLIELAADLEQGRARVSTGAVATAKPSQIFQHHTTIGHRHDH